MLRNFSSFMRRRRQPRTIRHNTLLFFRCFRFKAAWETDSSRFTVIKVKQVRLNHFFEVALIVFAFDFISRPRRKFLRRRPDCSVDSAATLTSVSNSQLATWTRWLLSDIATSPASSRLVQVHSNGNKFQFYIFVARQPLNLNSDWKICLM